MFYNGPPSSGGEFLYINIIKGVDFFYKVLYNVIRIVIYTKNQNTKIHHERG